jgi:hypothetical protein
MPELGFWLEVSQPQVGRSGICDLRCADCGTDSGDPLRGLSGLSTACENV